MAKIIKLKIVKIFLTLIIFSFPFFSFANIFPQGTSTSLTINNTGTDNLNTLVLDNTDGHIRTILSYAYQLKDGRRIRVYCNGNVVFDNKDSDLRAFQLFTQDYCNAPIYIDNMRNSSFRIVYVDADLSVLYQNSSFSLGEMFISLLLLIFLILAIITMIRGAIFAVSVHRKFLGNNSRDGKEFYKL